MARLIDRPETLKPPLEIRAVPSGSEGFMARAVRGSRLAKPLRQLGARGAYVPQPAPGTRGAVVKVWTTTKMGITSAHLRYLAQEGKGLFAAEDMAVDRRAFAQRARDDPHQFRMIVSLVDGTFLDLQAYIRAYM